jgi:TPR repeat protein
MENLSSPDLVKALDAALTGDSEAQLDIAYAYYYGKGVKPDLLRSRSWVDCLD